jgi:hypothetical protein
MAVRVIYWDWSAWLGRAAVSVPEAARMCGVSVSFMWKVIKAGGGPPLVRIMGRTLILIIRLTPQ